MPVVTEDRDARLLNGIETLSTSGVIDLGAMQRQGWTISAIVRTNANYTVAAFGFDPENSVYPERPVGELTANLSSRGLEWRWNAPNAAFDWHESDRSISELAGFLATEDYTIKLERPATGETVEHSVSIGVRGESNETFDVLVLGADADRESLVADNLAAAGLAAAFGDFEDALSRRVEYFEFDAILAYTNLPPYNPAPAGDLLRQFVDIFGGGVVLATYAFTTPFHIAGGITAPGYSPFSPSVGTGVGVPIGREIVPTAASADDPIFSGVDLDLAAGAFVVNDNYTRPVVRETATLLATDENGAPLLARNAAGTVIGANFFPRDFGGSNRGPNGESLLTPSELEFHQLLVRSLYAVHPLFDAPSAMPLTPVARAEVVDGVSYAVLEAEDAALSEAVLTFSGRGASGGGYVDFPAFDEPLEVSWTVHIAQDGVYAVDFMYALAGNLTPRPLTVLIDGETADIAPFLAVSATDWAQWAAQGVLLELEAGNRTITLRTDADRGLQNGANLDYLRISEAPVDPASILTPTSGRETVDGVAFIKHEAEAARLSDALLFDVGRGASGGVFVDFPVTDQSLSVSWSIAVAESGFYGVDFIHALPETERARPLLLSVDRDAIAFVPFEGESAGLLDWRAESIALHLDAGVHVLALTSPTGAGRGNGANLDYLRITATPIEDVMAYAAATDALIL